MQDERNPGLASHRSVPHRQLDERLGPAARSRSHLHAPAARPVPGGPLDLQAVELIRLRMSLVNPFTTSFGRQTTRDVLLVRATTDEAEGWGEATTPDEPIYSAEYTLGAQAVLRDHLLPRLLDGGPLHAHEVAGRLAEIRGHRMAKAAVESAVLDAQLRAAGRSAADVFGAVRDRVPSGVSVGVPDDGVPALLETVQGYLEDGYLRVKLKIHRGFDRGPLAAVRERWPDLDLQVDANGAYDPTEIDRLDWLDDFELGMVEQPFPRDELVAHRRLAERLATPICLDESLRSVAATADAIELGACEIVNLKLGRVGGWTRALAIHDLCLEQGVPLWIGGMLESGIGRAANVALAALPGVTLPGDTSASERYWNTDVTDPFVLDDGHLAVPDGAGFGVVPDPDVIDALAVDRYTLRAGQP